MALSDEDKAEIGQLIATTFTTGLEPIKKEFGRMANGAATTAAQAAVKGLKEKIESLPDPDALTAIIDAKIGEKVPAKVEPGKEKDQQQSVEAAVANALKASDTKWQKEVEAINKKLQVEAEEKAAIQKRQQRDEERTAMEKALEKAGVSRPVLRQGALALLSERGSVVRDDNGNIIFKSKGKHGEEETFTVEDGVAAWVATDEGKEYLPPKEVGGGGDGKGGKPPAKGALKPGMYDPGAVQAVLNSRR